MIQAQTRPPWDKRAWLIGMAGSSLCGLTHALGTAFLRNDPSRSGSMHHSGYLLATVATLTANFALPAVMAVLSRRRFLLWGLLPPFVLAVWAITGHVLRGEFGLIHRDFVIIPFYVILSVMLVSGPISAVRHFRARARLKRESALASLVARREAASVPQEGVWPPPPDYRQ